METRNRPSRIAVLALGLALASLPPLTPPAAAQEAARSGPVLEDQFGATTDLGAAFAAGPVVAVATNRRDAAGELVAWRDALRPLLPAGTRILLVADLRALPFFVPKGAVTGQLRKENPSLPILLDWKGLYCAELGLPGDGSVAELRRPGKPPLRVAGPPGPAAARSLAAALAGAP